MKYLPNNTRELEKTFCNYGTKKNQKLFWSLFQPVHLVRDTSDAFSTEVGRIVTYKTTTGCESIKL